MDADGPLARLKKAIFNSELYENIADWIVVSTRKVASTYDWSAQIHAEAIFAALKKNVYICYPAQLVGSAVDGHCSYYANGWLHQDLQCPHPQQQPQTPATKATARYSTSYSVCFFTCMPKKTQWTEAKT